MHKLRSLSARPAFSLEVVCPGNKLDTTRPAVAATVLREYAVSLPTGGGGLARIACRKR